MPEAHLDEARRLRAQGRWVDALDAYAAALGVGATAPLLAETAELTARLSAPDGERLARAALRLEPELPAASHALGEALARQGRFAEALEPLRAAVAADGHWAELRGGPGAVPWTERHPPAPCPTCASEDAELVYVGNASRVQRCFGVIDPIKVWARCVRCGLVRVPEPPAAAALAAYYAALRGEGGDVPPPGAEAITREVCEADRQLDAIEGIVGRPGRLLEAGCGWGVFLAAAAWRGFDVCGLELGPRNAAWARERFGVPVAQGSAPDDLPNGPFDAIALWEVIEHTSDPWALLRALRERLAPGGVVALSTPFIDHPAHRALGYDDPMWVVPGHLVYFDRATLEAGLARVGLRVARRWSSPRHIGSGVVICVAA